MKCIAWFIAVILALGVASIGDLLINFLLANTTNWGFLGEKVIRFLVFLGGMTIGWFFGGKLIKYVYNELQK